MQVFPMEGISFPGWCISLIIAAMNTAWESDLASCLACLRAGGVILYPTDTIWGLGCAPSSAAAVSKIYDMKGRGAEKSLILLASSLDQVSRLVGDIPDAARQQMKEAGDRPITIIYPRVLGAASAVAAADGSLAIRVTVDPFCKALIDAFGHPVTSTSANLSGQPFTGSFADIHRSLVQSADYVVRWRQAEEIHAAPSRIVKLLEDGNVQEIRP
jgi:L-threonylcarbamoyladenylate synthase